MARNNKQKSYLSPYANPDTAWSKTYLSDPPGCPRKSLNQKDGSTYGPISVAAIMSPPLTDLCKGIDLNRLPAPGELWINMRPGMWINECYNFSFPPYCHNFFALKTIPTGSCLFIVEAPIMIKDRSLLNNMCYHIKFLYENKISCSTRYFSFFPKSKKDTYHMLFPLDQLEQYKEILDMIE